MVYGTRAKHLGSFQVRDIPCPYCEQTETQQMSFFGRYAHIMWIPLFPIGKTPVAECTHCKRTYRKAEFSERLRLIAGELGQRVKSPRWMWAGLMIIGAIFLVSAVISGIQDRLPKDPRAEMLQADINAMMAEPMPAYDSTSVVLDDLMTMMAVEELRPETFTYLTKVSGEKGLVLVNVPDLERLESSARPEIMYTVEMIVGTQDALADKQLYYGIMGAGAQFMLVKTPTDSSYARYAKQALLYDFYGPRPPTE